MKASATSRTAIDAPTDGNASQEGTPAYVQDADVIKFGDAQHGRQFDADYQNERTGGNIPIDQWRADPSIGPHALMRTVLPVAAMPFDWSVQAADALANLNRKITGGEPSHQRRCPARC